MPPISRRLFLGGVAALASTAALGQGAAGRAPAPMRLGVVGAGWLGGSVGRAWIRAGHEVLFSTRNPDALRGMTDPLGPRARAGTARDAAAFADVLLFAVPYAAIPQLGRDLATALRGKIVLDACNPAAGDALAREAAGPGIGATTAKYLAGTRVVRAFSAVDATAIEASSLGRRARLGVPLAADDAAALAIAVQLVRDAGCDPVVVGTLAAGKRFERGTPAFRANDSAAALRRALDMAE